MVDLSPAAVEKAKYPRCADVQVFDRVAVMIGAAFPSHGPEHVADFPELDVDVSRTLEDDLVHLVGHVRAAADAPERVIDSNLVGCRKIVVYHCEIARVESLIELN